MIRQFILVAEDDPDDQYLLQTALSDNGFTEKVDFVSNGVELISFLNSLLEVEAHPELPKLIILDLNMPKMDGKEALRKIKSHAELRKIPVVVFTTTKNQREVQRCYDLGANTYVVKPSSYATLLDIVREICSYWFNIATLVER